MDPLPFWGITVIDTDKNEIVRVLQSGMDALVLALDGLDDHTATLKPHPASWSVLECVQHVVLVESALFTRLAEAKPAEASSADPAREARFQALALNRQRRIEAPDPVIPHRGSQTLSAALKEFHSARARTLRFVDEFSGDLRSWLTTHPLIARPVNLYEMLLLIGFHPQRHSLQIAEIREQLSPSRSQIK